MMSRIPWIASSPLTPRIAAIGALAVSGCDGSKTLEFGEEAFDEVAFAAELS
jgi:hypothetical protein